MLLGGYAQAAPDQRNTAQVTHQSTKAVLCHAAKCISRPKQGLSTTFLHPKVRAQSQDQALLGIPTDVIRPWLEHYLIVSTQSLEHAAYVLGSADRRVIAAAGQKIYVRGRGWVRGQRYSIYRHSEPYHLHSNASSTQVASTTALKTMQELIEVASGEVVDVEPDMASIQLIQTFSAEVRRGDLVFARPKADFPTRFEPISSEAVIAGGQIVRVMGSIAFAAKDSIVTIDRGQRHGAQVGQVLRIAQRGEAVPDPIGSAAVNLPQQHIGHVMVVKSFDQLSYAYVLDSAVPIYVGAQLQSLSTPDLNF